MTVIIRPIQVLVFPNTVVIISRTVRFCSIASSRAARVEKTFDFVRFASTPRPKTDGIASTNHPPSDVHKKNHKYKCTITQ